MDSGIVGAMAGVLGSLVGGSATVATAWITQRTLTRRELNVRDMRQREKLYADFIGECAKLLIDAFTHTLEDPEKLLPRNPLSRRRNACWHASPSSTFRATSPSRKCASSPARRTPIR